MICGKGLTSTPFGFELDEHGLEDVSVVSGGMEAWSKLYETVPIETDDDDVVIRQVQRRAKGCLGYVVGSKSASEGSSSMRPGRRISSKSSPRRPA
ncbi:rhodanese-like domain-containing protein [Haloarculaceae archaeon H-GB11]|nr:rhodanese-like domain-containing protein [Haloarculaceae archaeon H-GB11]